MSVLGAPIAVVVVLTTSCQRPHHVREVWKPRIGITQPPIVRQNINVDQGFCQAEVVADGKPLHGYPLPMNIIFCDGAQLQ